MPHVDCPRCSQRLRAPDSPGPLKIKCPTCGERFETDSNETDPPSSQPAAAKATSPANENILSSAEEAMLRDFGSGSGLLELTREAYGDSSLVDVNNPNAAAPHAKGQAAHDPSGERHFQVVSTALTLANKLVLTYKAELLRSRRHLRRLVIAVSAMTVIAAGLLAWGVSNLGRVNVQEATASGLRDVLEQEREDNSANSMAIKSRLSIIEKELADAREQQATSKASATIYKASLDEVSAKLYDVQTELGAARAESIAAKSQSSELAAQLSRVQATSRPAEPH